MLDTIAVILVVLVTWLCFFIHGGRIYQYSIGRRGRSSANSDHSTVEDHCSDVSSFDISVRPFMPTNASDKIPFGLDLTATPSH